jgi:hypothetical protein
MPGAKASCPFSPASPTPLFSVPVSVAVWPLFPFVPEEQPAAPRQSTVFLKCPVYNLFLKIVS